MRPDFEYTRQQLSVTSGKGGDDGGNRLATACLQVPLLPESVHAVDDCLKDPSLYEGLWEEENMAGGQWCEAHNGESNRLIHPKSTI